MRAELMVNDEQLDKLLEKRDSSFQVKHVQYPSEDAELLIVSDDVVHFNDLTERIPEVMKGQAFYLLSHSLKPNLFKHVKTVCDTLGVHMINSGLEPPQIVEEIYSTLFPEESEEPSKIAAFFAPISNIGTTSLALSAALSISRSTRARVGVLGLNAWDDGTDQLPYKGESLDRMKNKLSGHLLGTTEDQILSRFFKLRKDNVYYLAGNQNAKMERLYTLDEIYHLITVCQDVFDLLILDAGNHFDNANSIEALHQADLKFLVMNQQRKAIKKFQQSFRQILFPLGYSTSDFSLVINRYSDETGIPNDKEMISELSVPFLGKVPDVSIMGLHGEVQQNVLYDYGDSSYMQAVDFIAGTMINRAQLERVQATSIPKGRSKWRLFSRMGVRI